MIQIGENKFNNGETVYINDGRMKYIYGSLVGIREEDKIALIKIGTITSEVEMDFIQKVEDDRPKVYMTYVSYYGHDINQLNFVAAISDAQAKQKHPMFEETEHVYIVAKLIDEVEGYDVILQK